jgi:hypothetical protein
VKNKIILILLSGILTLSACAKGESAPSKPETNTSESNTSETNNSEANTSETNPSEVSSSEANTSESDSSENSVGQQQTTFVQDSANIVCAWISAAEPHDSLGLMYDPTILKFGKDTDTEPTVALLRFALPADILEDEVQSARLVLKSAEPTVALPDTISVGAVLKDWDMGWVNYAEFQQYLPPEQTAEVTALDDGYFAIDVTNVVKSWLQGDLGNNGFALVGTKSGENHSIYSSYTENKDFIPRLEVDYLHGERDIYGKFDYSQQIDGNCLSYTLRDTDGIYHDGLGIDYEKWVDLYYGTADASAGEEGDINAVLPDMTQKVLDYVNAHAETLKISEIRVLDRFDDYIDPAKEYRVALRVGARDSGGEFGVIDAEDFDYHFQAQLSGGSWAEKMPQDPSRVVPGSHAGLAPQKLQWDTSPMWGNDKWNNFYTSQAVYFAVTKDSDSFTSHLGGKFAIDNHDSIKN